MEFSAGAENDGTESEVVEDFAAVPPYIGTAVFPYAFIVEPVHGCDLP